jgi:HSP20 family protein
MLPTISRKSFRPFYMPDFFENNFFPVISDRTSSLPAVNIRESEKSYLIDLAIPGMDKKDLKIDINEDVLTISSETKNETEDSRNGFRRKEFSYSSFSRSFYIPENVERETIDATYKDGILEVTLPKLKEEKNNISREIKIS